MIQPLARSLLAAALCAAATSATAQRIEPPALAAAPAPAPLPADVLPPALASSVEAAPLLDPARVPASTAREGDRWSAPLLGMVIGAAVGGLVGWSVEKDTRDSLAPPAYYLSVPLGAALGFVVGLYAR